MCVLLAQVVAHVLGLIIKHNIIIILPITTFDFSLLSDATKIGSPLFRLSRRRRLRAAARVQAGRLRRERQ